MSSHLFVLIMDILAKSLDKGTLTNLFQLHPKCLVLMVTHLSFADDVLVFFDGSDSSLEEILCILDEFKQGSGLGINRHKTSYSWTRLILRELVSWQPALGLIMAPSRLDILVFL